MCPDLLHISAMLNSFEMAFREHASLSFLVDTIPDLSRFGGPTLRAETIRNVSRLHGGYQEAEREERGLMLVPSRARQYEMARSIMAPKLAFAATGAPCFAYTSFWPFCTKAT